MIDLGVLDNVIGVVVVILLLSMVVQSLQSFVKKLTKFKSRQIEKSLEKLLMQAAPTAPAQGAATANDVLEHFKQLGRVTTMNRHAVESIAKNDLTKIVASVESSAFLPEGIKEAVTHFLTSAVQAEAAIEALLDIELPPDAAAKLAELRQKLGPVFAEGKRLANATGSARAELIMRDLFALRDFPSNDVLRLVSEVQAATAQTAAKSPDNAVLQKAAAAAKDLNTIANEVHAKLGAVVAPMRERIASIERWYDTVMQGFEERYARHMRTWAFVISLIVTVVMNADLSEMYKRMATDDISKQLVVSQLQAFQQQRQATQAASTPEEATRQLQAELDQALDAYPAMGLEPLDWGEWLGNTTWGQKAESIVGWLVMAFLLSLGAPFWHDILESLFGLKNFLRNRTQTQNVEQRSGEGNPKSS
jgi:hypothetical protein